MSDEEDIEIEIRFPIKTIEALTELSKHTGRSVNDLIIEAIQQKLDRSKEIR